MVTLAVPATAQVGEPGPVGPYVVDVRGALGGLPSGPGFFPAVPEATAIPTRGFGVELGGHVYLLGFGPARIGIGASVVRTRGTARSNMTQDLSEDMSDPPVALPDTVTNFTTVAPQLSLNFGSGNGWSYLSAGLGRGRVQTAATSADLDDLDRDSGWVQAINYGAGARWFLTRRLAFGLDVRIHRLASGQPTTTADGTPRVTMSSVAVGISVR